jgi:mevalonate kinase
MKNNMYAQASAPGKLMLMGEHAVVYGYPSIVTACDTRIVVSVEQGDVPGVVVDAPGVSDTRFVTEAINRVKSLYARPFPNVIIRTKAQFSSFYGLGSSSAVTVATICALGAFLEMKFDKKTLFEQSYEVIRSVQQVASGFDVAAAVYGGTLLYGNGGELLTPIAVDTASLLVAYTGVKADTVSLVQSVQQKKQTYGAKVDRIFDAIKKLTEEAKDKMIEGDWERVGKLMDFNQEYLRDLGVSSEKIETLIHAARSAGAWGAKLSGAGGGDCIIAVAPSGKREEIKKAIEEAGGEIVSIGLGARGAELETTDNQSELFVVVDEKDSVIGYKSRYECHHDVSLMHKTVGAIVYNDIGEVLLQKRTMTKDMDSGLWGISCAGHVTKGQTDEEAIHRELQEELGVDMPLSMVGKFTVATNKETERATLYTGSYNGPFMPNKQEVAEVRFMHPDKLRKHVEAGDMKFTQAALLSFQLAGILL